MSVLSITGVLCCGNVVFDIAVWPVDNFDWNTTTWVETISEGIGGNGANTSYTLAKLGVPVCLASILGADEPGERLCAFLEHAGVDVAGILRTTEHPTPSTVVLVHKDGDRKFLHRPGASRELHQRDIRLPEGGAVSHFHLANPFSMLQIRSEAGLLMERAKQAGLTTSMDTGWDSRGRWIMDLGSALPYTDLLFVNEAEARLLGGSDDLESAVAALHTRGVPEVVVKIGKEGCSIYTQAMVEHVAGFTVDAVDSTGAGDCFAGAFLTGLYHGWPHIECARFANAVGAMNVEQIGATEGVRSFEETVAWIRTRG